MQNLSNLFYSTISLFWNVQLSEALLISRFKSCIFKCGHCMCWSDGAYRKDRMWLHRMEPFKSQKGVVDLEQGFRTLFHTHKHMHKVQANNSLMGESILLTMKPKAIRFQRRKPFETSMHTAYRSAGPCREGLVCCLWKLRALETILCSLCTCNETPDRVGPVPLWRGWGLGDDGWLSVCQTAV